jgi:transcriptional regulator with PAS, ATPase and Fis domain
MAAKNAWKASGGLVRWTAVSRHLDAIVNRIAAADVTVLIEGESGVGKDLVARNLHHRSLRGERPFVKVNCAALPVTLLESELFGYDRGAFTGAEHRKLGKFEQAHTGTIFLDEISEMPLSVQAKLLHVLQDHQFSRLGSEHEVRVDVRVIAATNRDLAKYVGQGGFREDLFYRLNVMHVRVPALRERPEEIPILVEHFLALYGRKHGRDQPRVSPTTLERFCRYSWPGNVRELENIVQRIVVLGTEAVVAELGDDEARMETVEPDTIPPARRTTPRGPTTPWASRKWCGAPRSSRSAAPSNGRWNACTGAGSSPRSASGSATRPCSRRSSTTDSTRPTPDVEAPRGPWRPGRRRARML